MKKLLILSTLLLCLTASNKTFSAEKEKKYRGIEFYKKGINNNIEYAILEHGITLDQTMAWLKENKKISTNFKLFDENAVSETPSYHFDDLDYSDDQRKKLLKKFEHKRYLFTKKNKLDSFIDIASKRLIEDELTEASLNLYVLKIKDVSKQKPDDKTANNIKAISIKNDTDNVLASLHKALNQEEDTKEKNDNTTNTNNNEKPSDKANKYFNKFNFGVFVIVVLIVVAVAAFIPKGKKSSNENKGE